MTDMGRIILASGSPRRRELLTALGVKDLIVRPAAGEEIVPPDTPPAGIVMALAARKAREVLPTALAGDVVIAADTIVWLDGEVLGKPRDAAHARQMLLRLSGKTHSVFTGVCVAAGDRMLSGAEETLVTFRDLSPREIDAYVATGEPMDKAGAYGVQGKASLFVAGIHGDFFNVVGLPLCRLGIMLKKVGVDLL